MGRESFHQLLQRYLDGRCTPAEERLVDHWYHMLEAEDKHEISVSNLAALEDAMWQKIHGRITDGAAPHSARRPLLGPRRFRRLLVAASVALLVALGAIAYLRVYLYPIVPSFTANGTLDSNIVVAKNDTDRRMNIILADESLVELYPGAELHYPKQFSGHCREVRLVGDAFFSVAPNKERSFWVFHEGMITKVLGTKFKIKAPRGNAKGEVIVYSGKVDVFYNVGQRNVVQRILSTPKKASLTTNQRAVLSAKKLEETVTENPLPVREHVDAVRHETYQDIPITSLAETLSELYALDVVADSDLSHTTFTGDISGIGLFKQLDIICTVTDTRYEVAGTTIFLRRKPY